MESIVAEIAVAVFALIGTFFTGIMTSQKTAFRLDQIEKRIEKHNQLMERVAILEVNESTQWKRIDEIRDAVERLKNDAN